MHIDILTDWLRIWPTAAFDNATRIKRDQIVKVVPVYQLTVSVGSSPMVTIHIHLSDGSQEKFSLHDVTNQATWTKDQAGLNQAMTDLTA